MPRKKRRAWDYSIPRGSDCPREFYVTFYVGSTCILVKLRFLNASTVVFVVYLDDSVSLLGL